MFDENRVETHRSIYLWKQGIRIYIKIRREKRRTTKMDRLINSINIKREQKNKNLTSTY